MREYTVKNFISWFNVKKKLIALLLLALSVGSGVLAYLLLNRHNPIGGLFVFLTVPTGAAMIALLLSALVKASNDKAALKRLEERGLSEQAEQALNTSDVQSLMKDRIRLDNRFIFGREMGLAAAWDDVRWCYIYQVNHNGVVPSHSLIICTADGKGHALSFPVWREDEMQKLMNSFTQYNPDILLGNSMENQNAYRQSIKNS